MKTKIFYNGKWCVCNLTDEELDRVLEQMEGESYETDKN